MKFRRSLFWDVDPKKIDTKKNAQYIIERIADLGDDKEARWVFDFYDKRFLKKIITKSRSIRPDTKRLWELILKSN